MDTKITGIALACVLLLFSVWQFRVLGRRAAVILFKRDRMAPELAKFLIDQTSRRFKMNLLFAVAAIGMLLGLGVSPREHPKLFLAFWGLVLIALGAGIILAVIDFVAVRLHYKLEQSINQAEKISIQYALDRLRDQAVGKASETDKQPAAGGGEPPLKQGADQADEPQQNDQGRQADGGED